MPHRIIDSQMHACVDNDGSVFKQGFDKYSIIPLFHPSHPELQDNKLSRFKNFMQLTHEGQLFARGTTAPPYGKTCFKWNKPSFNRLQSSYEDVEHELDVFRTHVAHEKSLVCLVGGDGLSIMRMEWTIARNPDKYLNPPIIIPMRGDHPHGTTHINHACWRLWYAWMEKLLTACDYAYIQPDFTVKESRHFEFALFICMRAVAEFVDEVTFHGAPIGWELPSQFLATCATNIDAAYCTRFLHDYAFMHYQMRRAIRAGDHALIDLCWREAFATFHTKVLPSQCVSNNAMQQLGIHDYS